MEQNSDNDDIYDVDLNENNMDTNDTITENIKETPTNKANYKKNKKYCNNCGKYGHYFRECKDAITSYGIICFKLTPYPLNKNQKLETKHIKYLAIRRRNTLSYVEFIRGKYKFADIKFIKTLFERMTIQEREDILTTDFDELWNKLWINHRFKKTNKPEFTRSKKKFLDLKAGVSVNAKYISIELLMKNTISKYIEPEWTFPKGRRNCYEDDLNCAKREFQEEANLTEHDYSVVDTEPVPERHCGTNNIWYRTIYYLALCTTDTELQINPENPAQSGEVSAIGWFSFEELYNNLLRDYPEVDDTKRCINEIHNKILQEFNENL